MDEKSKPVNDSERDSLLYQAGFKVGKVVKVVFFLVLIVLVVVYFARFK